MGNMEIWEALSTPPETALKKIEGGRLKGKYDINPQWRMKAITEIFGPIGFGWNYSIDRLWTEPGAGGEICAFALVSIKVKHNGEWSDPVPGIGGNLLIESEAKGLHTSDEAYKMAVTDALSVAFKSLGVAAEIYLGNFDGSKYSKQKNSQPEREETNQSIRRMLFSIGCKNAAEAAAKVKEMTTFEKDGKTIHGKEDYKQLSDKAAKFLFERLSKELSEMQDKQSDAGICSECMQPVSSGHAESCPNHEPFR